MTRWLILQYIAQKITDTMTNPPILTAVVRKAHFNAAHRLFNPNWTEKNETVLVYVQTPTGTATTMSSKLGSSGR